jgi:hypothetical protein
VIGNVDRGLNAKELVAGGVAIGLVAGLITIGLVAIGLVAGLIAAGIIAGLIATGLIATGLSAKGLSAKGLVAKGLSAGLNTGCVLKNNTAARINKKNTQATNTMQNVIKSLRKIVDNSMSFTITQEEKHKVKN